MPDVELPSPVTTASRLGLEGLALAEAVRLHEENRGFLIEDGAAEAAAIAAGGDLQQRIVTRAGALAIAADIRGALDRLRRLFGFTAAAGFLLAVAAGAGSALALVAAAPPGSTVAAPTNFFLLYGSLLGPHAVMLLVWLLAVLVLPQRGSGGSLGAGSLGAGSLGDGILALVRRFSRWTLKQPLEAAAARAFALVMAASPAGRWLVSALSHGLWFGYLAGGLAMVFLLLSTRQVSFGWETTILSADHYIAFTRALAAAPAWLGFAAPDAQQIAASQIPLAAVPAQAAADRAWAGLLLGSLVVYGALPRFMLALVCLGLSRRAIRRYRFDPSRPGFARLQERLVPLARPTGVIDADRSGPAASAAESPGETAVAESASDLPGPAQVAGDGPVAILAFETERPEGGWPPPPAGLSWLDCGSIEDRADRARVHAGLRAAVRPPRLLVLACSLLTAPDRGVQAFLAELAGTAGVPLALLLSEGQRYQARTAGDAPEKAAAVGQRIADWRRIGVAAGIPAANIAAIDLDQPAAATRKRLQAWLGGSGGAMP